MTREEASSLRKAIENFLQNRLQEKLNKEKKADDDNLEKIKQAYEIENWLDDAARRANQIQLATHALKYMNPDAKGSNIYVEKANQEQFQYNLVATQTLIERKNDVTGSAAALDIYKFLELTHEHETLLERILRNDSTLRAALPGTEENKDNWFRSFASITKERNAPSSHTLAKQIYFPIEDEQYHLLAPLFPTSLIQAVYDQIQTRFNETTKAARIARKENKPYPQGYREYVNLAVQTFGGSKPQNVSQLNSNRGGKTYLLASLPPNWRSVPINPPLNVKSLFQPFGYRVRELTKTLREFLEKKIKQNNIDIRDRRAVLVAEICDELLAYAAEIQSLIPGWSADKNCQLSKAQTYWLDPKRTIFDFEWAKEKEATDWKQQISDDFATWLNQTLETDKLVFGDAEHDVWEELLKRELALFREIIE